MRRLYEDGVKQMDPSRYLPRWVVIPVGLVLALSTIASQSITIFLAEDAAPTDRIRVAGGAAFITVTSMILFALTSWGIRNRSPIAFGLRLALFVVLTMGFVSLNTTLTAEFYARVVGGEPLDLEMSHGIPIIRPTRTLAVALGIDLQIFLASFMLGLATYPEVTRDIPYRLLLLALIAFSTLINSVAAAFSHPGWLTLLPTQFSPLALAGASLVASAGVAICAYSLGRGPSTRIPPTSFDRGSATA